MFYIFKENHRPPKTPVTNALKAKNRGFASGEPRVLPLTILAVIKNSCTKYTGYISSIK